MKDQIKNIYEDSRQLLFQSERIDKTLVELNNLRLRYELSELKTDVQSSLMLLIEFCYEILQSENDFDLESIVEQYRDLERLNQ